jgi:Lon protease-like protein
MFPLGSVLFPHAMLPLHVFEPRYRALVTDVLDSHRTIGMTLLKPGYEADYQGRPPVYPLGCAGTIVEQERLADGRYNIVLHGRERFRILEEQVGAPYRVARVEKLGDVAGDGDSLDRIRRQLLDAFERLGGGSLVVEGDVPPAALVNGLCQQLDLPVVEKLDLLACDSIESRARRLVELLEYHALERESGPATDMN